MRRFLACTAFCVINAASVVAQPLPETSPESAGMSSVRLQRIEAALNREIEQGNMPGAVVAIARGGNLVYYEAFGYLDKESGTPMRKDAIFAIASMTKPVVAVGAMLLYEEGLMLMDDPVSTYLPELNNRTVAVDGNPAQTESARRAPTIEDLLRHTAGYTYGNQGSTALHAVYPSGSSAAARSLDASSFLQALADLPLHHQPGTVWDYGFGLDIAGLAIERITDKTLGEFFEERILEPLGMNDTAFVVPAARMQRLARPLPNDPLSGSPQSMPDLSKPLRFECGGGCLTSTALDYMAFAQMLLNKGELNGRRLLAPGVVEYMTSDHADPEIDLSLLHAYPSLHLDGHGFGLGVAVRRATGLGGAIGSPGAFHWSGAYGTAFWVDPQRELAIVLMAQTPGRIRERNRQLLPILVYQAIVD
ncbi:MAG: serine hydrolase domain-containing protein [Gammaproteobacteria bacterium]|jgi:CubicO group peptidase (beta-lactamase class C family)